MFQLRAVILGSFAGAFNWLLPSPPSPPWRALWWWWQTDRKDLIKGWTKRRNYRKWKERIIFFALCTTCLIMGAFISDIHPTLTLTPLAVSVSISQLVCTCTVLYVKDVGTMLWLVSWHQPLVLTSVYLLGFDSQYQIHSWLPKRVWSRAAIWCVLLSVLASVCVCVCVAVLFCFSFFSQCTVEYGVSNPEHKCLIFNLIICNSTLISKE